MVVYYRIYKYLLIKILKKIKNKIYKYVNKFNRFNKINIYISAQIIIEFLNFFICFKNFKIDYKFLKQVFKQNIRLIYKSKNFMQ